MRDRENTPIPPGFYVRHIPARTAKGAYKPKAGAIMGATSPRATAMPLGRRDVLRTVALKGW